MKEKLMPPVVLTLVCIIVSALLVFAYNKTYIDTTGVMTEQLSNSCKSIFGNGEYRILLEKNTDKKVPLTFGVQGVKAVITDGKEKCLIELEQDGYAKGGLHVLIGFDKEGKLCGVGFLDMGETPGLGTKVRDQKSFTEQFIGLTEKTEDFEPITGATFSSKGMKAAIDKALDAYNDQLGGAAK